VSRHESIEEALRLLVTAYEYFGNYGSVHEWSKDTKKFIDGYKDYGTNTATKPQYTVLRPDARYIVLRPDEELEGKVSDRYNGYWYDYNELPLSSDVANDNWATAKPHPNKYYEKRSDGAIAEVWVVSLNHTKRYGQ
jgi:hypothetical protein